MHKLNSSFAVSTYPQCGEETSKQHRQLLEEQITVVILGFLTNDPNNLENAWINFLGKGGRHFELITVSFDHSQMKDLSYLREINRLILEPLTQQKKVVFYGRNWDLAMLVGLTCSAHLRESSSEDLCPIKSSPFVQSLVREYTKKCLCRVSSKGLRRKTSIPDFIRSIRV